MGDARQQQAPAGRRQRRALRHRSDAGCALGGGGLQRHGIGVRRLRAPGELHDVADDGAEQQEQHEAVDGGLRRTAAHEDQQKKYTSVKEIKDKFYSSRRAAVEYEREARRIRDEKRRAENDAYHRGRRQEVAKEKLEEASAPAYQDEIRTTQALLYHFDPSSVAKPEAAGPGKFAATASRKVEGQ